MAKHEKLALGTISANIIDVIVEMFELCQDDSSFFDSKECMILEEKIIDELRPLRKPTDYGYDTDEVVE